jgi:nucleoside-diphosphate-sugar epimerase
LRRALVTGASGFLGQHLIRRFGESGWRVDLIDIKPLPEGSAVERAIQADIRDVLPTLDQRYDLAIHLAASVGGRVGIEHDPLGVAFNMALDAEFFSFVCRTTPLRCIYLSSSAVYPVDRQTGAWDGLPLLEEEVNVSLGPLGLPDLAYGWAKLTGEYLALLTQRTCGVPMAVYRPFSIYGPGQSREYPMTAICERALTREDPLVVWGAGTQQRDFVHIEDFLHLVMATYRELDAASPLNIATGTGVDFLTVARTAAGLVGYQPTVEALEDRPQGVQRRIGSPTRMSRWLTPRVTLEDGLASIMRELEDGNLASRMLADR